MARAAASTELDELPEADRRDGAPHPRRTRVLLGHGSAEAALAQAFAGGRMHHAWLIKGPAGIGKATLAWRLARFMLATSAERDPEAGPLAIRSESREARLVDGLAHPGLLLIRRPYDTRSKRFAASIPVDEVRRVRRFLGLTEDDGRWRVVIVDSADELNVNAANALLKSLEEPPVRTLFLLVSSEPGRLLITIRSRCRALALEPLGTRDLRRAVTAALDAEGTKLPAEDAWPRLEALGQGSPGRVMALLSRKGLDLQARIERVLGLLPKVDWEAGHALAEELGPVAAEQDYETFFGLFLEQITRLVKARASGEGAPGDVQLGERLIPEAKLASWAALWETTLRAKADVDALNLDRRTLVLETLSRLEALARG